jgi:uncharacterized phage infection (PIP) family protein YhgE
MAKETAMKSSTAAQLLAVLTVLAVLVPLTETGSAVAHADESLDQLAERERVVSQQMRELEATFLRLADLLEASDPRRATTLRSVFEQARESEVTDRLDAIVKLLEAGQLLKAGTGQETALDRLRQLLATLEAGESRRTATDTKKQVKEFLSRMNELIARQMGLEGTTEAGGDPEAIAKQQQDVAADTKALASDVEQFRDDAEAALGLPEATPSATDKPEKPAANPAEDPSADGEKPAATGDQPAAGSESEKSQPGQGTPGESSGAPTDQEEPSDQEPQGDDETARAARSSRRLAAAEERMKQAGDRLRHAERKEAREEQEQALAELEAARAELEEILRQLREEEIERLLVKLEARVREMLRAERAVLRGLDQLKDDQAGSTPRERELESARLGREQDAITVSATRALTLVRDDGSAVAIPEALEQIRTDSVIAAGQLKRAATGSLTRATVADLAQGLEELLAALEQAEREQQERQQQKNPAGGRPAEPGEQPLVDTIAELKMLRTLQSRINRQTGRFSQLLDENAEQVEEPQLLEALGKLATRQERIERAAHDIVSGRTEQ